MDIRKIIREEADEMDWIKGVPDTIPSMMNRSKVPVQELFDSYLRSDARYVDELFEYLEEEEYIDIPRDEEGNKGDTWNWVMEPNMNDYELREWLESLDTDEWEWHTSDTLEYELEYSASKEVVIFKRKTDNRYFGYTYWWYYHDGDEDADNILREYFPQQVTRTEWR
jgi:hypothetical protein